MIVDTIARTGRGVFAVTALLGIMVSRTPVRAAPAPMTEAERSNGQTVAAFMKAWELQPAEAAAAKLGSFLAEDCVIRLAQTRPPIVGKDRAIAQFKTAFSGNYRFRINILESFSRESVVTVWRKDLTLQPGKPDVLTPVVGVFYMKDGKIEEWTDYLE